MTVDQILPLAVFGSLFIAELIHGCYSSRMQNINERLIAWLAYIQQFSVIRPIIAFVTAGILTLMLPQSAGLLADLPFWPVLLIHILIQDFIQYWYHRFSHEWPWLWQFHKTHHTAPNMNVLVTSRGNIFWFFLMPTLYYQAVVIHLGLLEVFAWGYSIRAVISIASHSDFRWDLPLFNSPVLGPFMKVFSKVITLPDTHHAHHGMGQYEQGNGNYAPMIFFYDFIFGSARIPVHRQESFGVPEGPGQHWAEQLWWPLTGILKSPTKSTIKKN